MCKHCHNTRALLKSQRSPMLSKLCMWLGIASCTFLSLRTVLQLGGCSGKSSLLPQFRQLFYRVGHACPLSDPANLVCNIISEKQTTGTSFICYYFHSSISKWVEFLVSNSRHTKLLTGKAWCMNHTHQRKWNRERLKQSFKHFIRYGGLQKAGQRDRGG